MTLKPVLYGYLISRDSNFCGFCGCLISTKMKHDNITLQGIKIFADPQKYINPRILYALAIHEIFYTLKIK